MARRVLFTYILLLGAGGCGLDFSGPKPGDPDAGPPVKEAGPGQGEGGATPGACGNREAHDCDLEPPACVSLDSVVGYKCNCPEGYSGSGVGEDGCVDVDECAAETHSCDRAPATTCANAVGDFSCGACPDGFVGDAKRGAQGCEPLLDGLRVSKGALEPAFAPAVTQYELSLKLWEDAVDITPTARPGFALSISGAAAASEQATTTFLDVGDNAVELTVQYGGATRPYTLAIKRSTPPAQFLKATNRQTNDTFGYALALSSDGNLLVIGAPGEDSATTGIGSTPNEDALGAGAAYVFVRNAAGAFTQRAYLKAPNTGAGDDFGRAVAISADGSTIAVGAPGEDSSASATASTSNEDSADSGVVYVFTFVSDTWTPQGFLKATNAGASDALGAFIALSANGSTLAAGARNEDSVTTNVNSTPGDTASNAGAAYVFARSGNAWSQQAYVKASNTSAGDKFGARVGLSGDGNTLVVGAPNEDSSTKGVGSTPDELAPDAGAIYLYRRTGITWAPSTYLKPLNTGAGDTFGEHFAISLDGQTLAVSAKREDSALKGINPMPDESAENAGAAYVFVASGGTWSQQAYIKSGNAGANDFFGEDLALSSNGDVLVVSGVSEDSSTQNDPANNGVEDSGAAYVFLRRAGRWSQAAYLKSPDIDTQDYFSDSLALSADGRTLVSGAYSEDSSSASNEPPNDSALDSGAVYVF